MDIAVIIPAAGASRRYIETAESQGLAPRHKIDEDIGGRPVLQRTVELFNKRADVSFIVVAGPADAAEFASFKDRHGDKLGLLGVTLCQGGATHRWETVRNALARVPAHCTHVAVHDAARPCASEQLIDRVFEAAEAGHKAVVPGIDVPDTLKRVTGEEVAGSKPDPLAAILGDTETSRNKARVVEQTIDRARLVAVQTPQVFEIGLIRRAYGQKDLNSTDDAQLVERLGERVVVVPGEPGNLKITRGSDIHLARAILGVRGPSTREAHKRF